MEIKLKSEIYLFLPILNTFEITSLTLGKISVIIEHLYILQQDSKIFKNIFNSSELRLKSCNNN